MKPAITEKAFMAYVIKAARVNGFRVAHFRPAWTSKGWRTPVEGDGAGFPDLCLVNGAKGRVIFAELKSDKGELSEKQADWINDLSCCEQIEVYCWRPRDMDTLWTVLRGESLGVDEETLLRWQRVCERVAPRIRIRPFSACREVCLLSPQDQQKWLERYVKESWDVRELKKHLESAGLRHTRSSSTLAETFQKSSPYLRDIQYTLERRFKDLQELNVKPKGADPDRLVQATCYICGEKATITITLCPDCCYKPNLQANLQAKGESDG